MQYKPFRFADTSPQPGKEMQNFSLPGTRNDILKIVVEVAQGSSEPNMEV